MWDSSRRAVILVLLAALALYLGARFLVQHAYVSDPQPMEGARASELADRVDPNTATIAQIAAIPNVGGKLAGGIVEYRESYLRTHPGAIAFEKASDLLRVRGVGVAKMELLMGHMVFPGKPATTRH